MNLQENFMVMLLTAFDCLMDFITLGWWTKVRGEVVPQVKITKRSMK